MGLIETAMTRRFVDETTQLPVTNNKLMRRLGDADEVAQVLAFLRSEALSIVSSPA